ncbi:MAG: Nif3-like dinuclear metal center hexameric protein [Anaerolineae bacterium]|nr:Nif3-like dinuclear metal center hexameric protein [Anaerolineae bacterium]
MNTNELREYLLSRAPWVDPANTVDTVKAGDPTRPVRTVGVGWVASSANLRAAAELGCELFITHEPTFWEHAAPEQQLRTVEPGRSKQRLLDETGLVVLRIHDTWDRWPEHGIRDSWARGLGLTQRIAEDGARWQAVFEIEPTPLLEFARHVARRVRPLGEDSVRIIGDPARTVRRPAIGTGCAGPDADMVALGADVLIVCYDGASYWQTRERLADLGAAVVTVEHGTSEMWGMESLARYLSAHFPDLTVHYLDRHPRAWTVTG